MISCIGLTVLRSYGLRVLGSEGLTVLGSEGLTVGRLDGRTLQTIRPKDRAGFSLIEVLVATTILIVIVMMVSMVFHQSIGSWSSGTRRADSQMVVRTILGSIQRDLANAIPDDGNTWNNSKISFYAIAGTPEEGPHATAIQQITYSYSGGYVTRKQDDEEAVKLNESFPLESFKFDIPDVTSGGLPPRVDVSIEVKTDGTEGIVFAHSRGPDGIDGTKDDIYVGGRP